MQMAHALLILAPKVVVKMPILKLANKNIPYVTNHDISFDSTKLASNPISNVAIHNIFPNRDACNDFEYSFFLVKRVSINWVIANVPITAGILNHIPSEMLYPKWIVAVITAAITNEPNREK